MSNIAIITARGASKRVPRENIRPFLGKPVIAYSIQAAQNACCLYPTAPFVTPYLLQQAFSTLTNHKFDTVYPVQRFGFPIQRAVSLHNQRVEWLQPEHALTRSQDLEPAYHDAGQFYFFNVAAFQSSHRLITDNSGGVAISEMAAHDIDTENDWRMAELKFRLMNEQ